MHLKSFKATTFISYAVRISCITCIPAGKELTFFFCFSPALFSFVRCLCFPFSFDVFGRMWERLCRVLSTAFLSTVELQWLEYLWKHENIFERGVVELMSVNGSAKSGGIKGISF